MYIDGMPMRATRGRRNQLCLRNEAHSDVSVDGATLSSDISHPRELQHIRLRSRDLTSRSDISRCE